MLVKHHLHVSVKFFRKSDLFLNTEQVFSRITSSFNMVCHSSNASQLVVYLSPGVGYGAVPMQSLATRLSGLCCAPKVIVRRGRCPCLNFCIRITP